uniref:Uncharacterized protein n=1 Tax=Knipowitschia caucasica TaxID=637954 RepID=A0AAV2MNK1_KNICA
MPDLTWLFCWPPLCPGALSHRAGGSHCGRGREPITGRYYPSVTACLWARRSGCQLCVPGAEAQAGATSSTAPHLRYGMPGLEGSNPGREGEREGGWLRERGG